MKQWIGISAEYDFFAVDVCVALVKIGAAGRISR
jgi:hypothetical protein